MEHSAIRAFHKRLHRWYGTFGRRDLPWRTTADPYHIYVSEIMLQQTQVKTVLERFYFPFLKRFPTLAALAEAPGQEIMKAWEGLGYYNRAANLHETAKQITSSSGDLTAGSGGASRDPAVKPRDDDRISLPRSVEELIALPGIGRNTAHAVAAFAYGQAVPVMEANVKRVLCRIFAIRNPSPEGLWEKAALLLDAKNPYDYNQAMMDIGAMVCTKRNPKCEICPANIICEGQRNPEAYPAKVEKKTVPVREKWIVVPVNKKDELYLQKRTTRFLTGLYGFPETDPFPLPLLGGGREGVGHGHGTFSSALGQPHPNPPLKGEGVKIPAFAGMTVQREMKRLGKVIQQYSHFTLKAEVFLVKAEGKGAGWYDQKEAKALPLSRADIKVLALLDAAGL